MPLLNYILSFWWCKFCFLLLNSSSRSSNLLWLWSWYFWAWFIIFFLPCFPWWLSFDLNSLSLCWLSFLSLSLSILIIWRGCLFLPSFSLWLFFNCFLLQKSRNLSLLTQFYLFLLLRFLLITFSLPLFTSHTSFSYLLELFIVFFKEFCIWSLSFLARLFRRLAPQYFAVSSLRSGAQVQSFLTWSAPVHSLLSLL